MAVSYTNKQTGDTLTAAELNNLVADIIATLAEKADLDLSAESYEVLAGVATLSEYLQQNDQALKRARSTGNNNGLPEITGMGTSVLTIPAHSGAILDDAGYHFLDWAQYTRDYSGEADGLRWYYVDQNSTIQETTTSPELEDYYDKNYLVRVSVRGESIVGFEYDLTPFQQLAPQIKAIFAAIGRVHTGLTLSAGSAADFSIKVGAGVTYGAGINNDPKFPHGVRHLERDAPSVRVSNQNNVQAAETSQLDFTTYDLNGVTTAIPGTGTAANRASVKIVYMYSNGNIRLLDSQQYWDDVNAAVQGINSYNPIVPPIFANAYRLGAIVAAKNAVDNTEFTFVPVEAKFGAAQAVIDAYLEKANNLSDLQDADVARTNLGAIGSDTTQAGGGTAINNIVTLTQAQYDAIGTKDNNTLYEIV